MGQAPRRVPSSGDSTMTPATSSVVSSVVDPGRPSLQQSGLLFRGVFVQGHKAPGGQERGRRTAGRGSGSTIDPRDRRGAWTKGGKGGECGYRSGSHSNTSGRGSSW